MTQHKKTPSRRQFIKNTTLGAGGMVALSSFDYVEKLENDPSHRTADLHLEMTGYDYSRMTALFDKKVEIKNCSYTMRKSGGIGDMNINTFAGAQTFDVTEIGMVPYILAYANQGFRDYTLLPIFPLRMFRHKSIFIHADSSIKKPEDLKGKKIGTPGYSSSSLTWIRGMVKDEYGINPEDIQWVIATKDSSADVSGNISEQEQVVPDGITISKGTPGKDESDLLLSGEVDALFHAAQPKAFIQGNPNIKRLFEDSRKTEQEYYSRTGIFPIMHAVAVRKTLLEENNFLAASLFDAYSASKKMDYQYMMKLGWAYDTLPWYGQELEETKKVMSNNFYSYGLEANRKILETLCRYCYEQGFIKEKLNFEDLFFRPSFSFTE
ncbi:ABC transporter substrate-binding protein [Lutimonas sp.]|uniref:ABC transporter substrate-binding protein n=1 Tax=Lutimonas sp. TaxID=1872403 RepID=UPI003D9BDC5E